MILWICALGLMAGTAFVSYYQGAVRAAITLIGLILGSLVAIPLGGLVKPLVEKCGVHHPVLLAFLGPVAVFVVLLIVLKIAAFFVHQKVEVYYKYRVADTQRMMWERMNQRVGACVGVVNGAVYVLVLGVLIYQAGYPMVQVSSDRDPLWMRAINSLSQDMQMTKMVRAVAPFAPAAELYYDASDMLALIFRNPLLQNRVSKYPPLIMVAEQPDFQQLGKDVNFQQMWVGQPSIEEFAKHEKLQPMLANLDLYNNLLNIVTPDIHDLRDFLLTGKSTKYDDERILGKWEFDAGTTYITTRKKPTITTVELKRLRAALVILSKATLIATIDRKAILKTARGASEGSWKNDGPSQYKISVTDGGKKQDVVAMIEGNRLLVSKDGFLLVFEK